MIPEKTSYGESLKSLVPSDTSTWPQTPRQANPGVTRLLSMKLREACDVSLVTKGGTKRDNNGILARARANSRGVDPIIRSFEKVT